ncbi:MAG: tetraacyldisaccharide 4'-kinase [Candidatus Omnitrophica bacterium]|nr:tetraacyldisaccharide 4'-kinase [Candidatus Omnitrophota bacterium]
MSILLSLGELFYRIALGGVGLLYRLKLLKVHRLPAPVISVGNLTWGGTGKSSLVMKLAPALKEKGRSPAVLLRGYGGDETRLLRERLHPIPVLAGPDRVATGTRAVKELGADLLILDDGYQQWRLRKDLEILMVDATAPFGNGHLIPRGTLREPVRAAARADLIVVTRADLVDPAGLKGVQARLRLINGKAPILFARYRPVELRALFKASSSPLAELKGEPVCTLAGIAGPGQFEAAVRGLGARVALSYRVRDHHPYTVGELTRLFARCQGKGIRRVVTTPKDAVRIPSRLTDALGPDLKGIELLVLEVILEFEPDESELLHRIDTLLPR